MKRTVQFKDNDNSYVCIENEKAIFEISKEDLQAVEDIVNSEILKFTAVDTNVMPIEEAVGHMKEAALKSYLRHGQDVVDKIANDAKPVDNNGTIPSSKQPVINSIKIVEK